MRSLIIGATGRIGSALVTECEGHCRTHLGTWYRTPHPDHAPLDVRDAEGVADLVTELEPEAVYLAAGVADAGYVESHPEESREVNVEGVANVVRAVRRLGGRLVYFAPADVFGECRTARREDDPPAPASVIGLLTAEAEALIREELPGRHLILRSGCVYGTELRARGFVSAVTRNLAAGEPVPAASDRQVQPTFADDLAAAATELVTRGYTGTFHAVGPERMTEFTFARLIAFVHHFDADLVRPVPARELGDGPRVLTPWLDRFKLRSVLGMTAIRFPADGLRAIRDRAMSLAQPVPRLRVA
jgi:dTDP-4-dehydrorhamnose reductase